MKTRGRHARAPAVILGLLVAAGYVAILVVVGSRDLLVRRPLLDGFITPQPYNWVNAPPALRATNKRPASGTFTIQISPRTGSAPKVFTTADSQASLAIAQGAIRPTSGETSGTLTISPLAPRGFPTPADGVVIAGNVYRYRIALAPSGTAVTRFRVIGQVVLAYPAPPARSGYHHELLYSPDGKTPWAPIQGIDSPTQQLVQADASGPGYYAVGRTKETSGTSSGRSYGNLIVTIVVVAIVAAIVVGIIVSEIRMRRRRAESEWQGGGGPKRSGTKDPAERSGRTPKRRRRRR